MKLLPFFAVAFLPLLTSCEDSKPHVNSEAACASGDAQYCYGAGLKAYTGKIENYEAITTMYMRKACDLGDGAGCTFMAAGIDGSKAATEIQLSQAFKLYLEGCELEDIVGCEGASELLLVGRGVNADLNAAHRYHLKALKLSNGDPKTGVKYKKLLKSINE